MKEEDGGIRLLDRRANESVDILAFVLWLCYAFFVYLEVMEELRWLHFSYHMDNGDVSYCRRM